MMITNNADSQVTVTDITSFVIEGDVEFDSYGSSAIVKNTEANDKSYVIGPEGIISSYELPFTSTDPDYEFSVARCASGKFSAYLGYIFLGDGNVNVISFEGEAIRGFRNSLIYFLGKTNTDSEVMFATEITPYSYFGEGLHGDEGSSMATWNPEGGLSQSFIGKIDSEGNVTDSVHIFDPAGESVYVKDIKKTMGGGYLVKVEYAVSEMLQYILIPAGVTSTDDESVLYTPKYDFDITMKEGMDGTFYLFMDRLGSNDELIRLDALLNPVLADDADYTWAGPTSVKTIIAGDELILASNGATTYMYGADHLDLRHAANFDLPGGYTIISFDEESMTAKAFITYTGDETIGDIDLEFADDGEIGIAYVTLNFYYSGSKIMLSDVDPDVLNVFDYMERDVDDINLMVESNKYESYMVFENEATYGILLGSDVPTDWYSIPEGWGSFGSIVELDDEGYYFVVVAGFPEFGEVVYLRVNLTTDNLYIPFVNTPPVILGDVHLGSCSTQSNYEYVFTVNDVDGDDITLFLGDGCPAGLSFTENSLFVDIPEIGEYEFSVYCTDGTDTVSVTRSITITDDLGTADFDFEKVVKVFPNPTVDFINVQGNFDVIEIYSMAGELVLETSESKIDFSNVSTGTYILRIFSENKSSQVTVVKQ